MDNMTLKLDPYTRDLIFDDEGILETIYDDETSAQNVRNTLLVYKGEFPFDQTHGTDYDKIMGRKASSLPEDEIEEIIRSAIFQETTVSQIVDVQPAFSGRGLNIAFQGLLKSGAYITSEVKGIE